MVSKYRVFLRLHLSLLIARIYHSNIAPLLLSNYSYEYTQRPQDVRLVDDSVVQKILLREKQKPLLSFLNSTDMLVNLQSMKDLHFLYTNP